MSIFNKEVIDNEYDLKIRELNIKVIKCQDKLKEIIKELKKIDTIKKSFIIYTEFNTKADKEYDNYLKYFESTIKSLTFAINEYDDYYLQNYKKFNCCKSYKLKGEDYIYNFIKINIINNIL